MTDAITANEAPSTADVLCRAAAEVLRRSADIIEERGWTRGVYERDGRLCADGALRTVCFGDPRPRSTSIVGTPSTVYATAAAVLRWNVSPLEIPNWNDAQSSRQRVTAKLREVADSLDVAW